MVRIPSDEEQDDTERQLRMREYMELFREEMDMIKRQGKKKELISKICNNIRKANQIVYEWDELGNPTVYQIQFIMTDGSQLSLTAEEAIAYNRKAVALLSNLNGWPEMYDEWSWTADQCEFKLPMDILDEEE